MRDQSVEHDLSADLRTNKFKLDAECATQASVYHWWADSLADARTESDEAKDNLKLVLAQRAVSIRESWPQEKKLTEASVLAELESDGIVLAARKRLRQADADVYHLEAAVKALEHKRDALENLTHLWGKAYYALPDQASRQSMSSDAVGAAVRGSLNKKGE